MIEDPTNPSLSFGTDGSTRVTFDARTAPITTSIREHAMKALENATNATEQAQAVNDALSAAFTAIAYFEFELRKLGPLPGGGNN